MILLMIENIFNCIGMLIIEFPFNLNNIFVWVLCGLLCFVHLPLYSKFYKNYSRKRIVVFEVMYYPISILFWVIFRIAINEIYNNVIFLGDNYMILVSTVYWCVYNMLKLLQFFVYIFIIYPRKRSV